jgi:hypothetical protein
MKKRMNKAIFLDRDGVINKRFAKEHELALLAARWKLPSDDIAKLILSGIRWEEVTKYAGRTGILPIVAYNLSSNKKICSLRSTHAYPSKEGTTSSLDNPLTPHNPLLQSPSPLIKGDKGGCPKGGRACPPTRSGQADNSGGVVGSRSLPPDKVGTKGSSTPLAYSIPEDVKQHLRWVMFMTTARNLQMYKVLAHVISAFQKESIDVILLKGPYLAATVYPNIGARAFSDLDLLVKRIDLPKVEACFHTMNFFIPFEEQHPRELDKKHNFHLPFTDGKGSIVEIHWDFEREIRFSNKSLIREFWANAEKKSFDFFEVKVLSLEDTLLTLCLHYAYHLLGMLGILSDIDKFVSFYKEKLNWEKFLLTAKKHALSRVAYLSLYYAAELFDTDIPQKVLRRLLPKWYVKILHSELCRTLVLNETESEISGTRSVIRAALMESRETQFKYVLRYTFPPLEEVKLIYKAKSFRDVCIYYAILPFLCLKKAVKVCLWIRELIKRRDKRYCDEKRC